MHKDVLKKTLFYTFEKYCKTKLINEWCVYYFFYCTVGWRNKRVDEIQTHNDEIIIIPTKTRIHFQIVLAYQLIKNKG